MRIRKAIKILQELEREHGNMRLMIEIDGSVDYMMDDVQFQCHQVLGRGIRKWASIKTKITDPMQPSIIFQKSPWTGLIDKETGK